MKYNIIGLFYTDANYNPKCDRCGYSHHYTLEKVQTEEWICPACLTREEALEILREIRKRF